MIDTIVRAIDRFIELRRYQADRLQKQSAMMVVPIMADLERVQNDYLQIFLDARNSLATGSNTLEETIALLTARRVQFEPVREKLMAMSSSLDDAELLPPIKEFASSLRAYLPRGDITGSSSGTAASSLIHELSKIAKRPKKRVRSTYSTWPDSQSDAAWREWFGSSVATDPDPRWGSDPVACMDWFISSQRRKWRLLCDAAARVQAAVASSD